MVQDIVTEVLRDNSSRRVTTGTVSAVPAASPAQAAPTASAPNDAGETPAKPRKRIIRAGSICPQCGQGKVIKGHTAYGCSRWKEGCDWRKPFKKE